LISSPNLTFERTRAGFHEFNGRELDDLNRQLAGPGTIEMSRREHESAVDEQQRSERRDRERKRDQMKRDIRRGIQRDVRSGRISSLSTTEPDSESRRFVIQGTGRHG